MKARDIIESEDPKDFFRLGKFLIYTYEVGASFAVLYRRPAGGAAVRWTQNKEEATKWPTEEAAQLFLKRYRHRMRRGLIADYVIPHVGPVDAEYAQDNS